MLRKTTIRVMAFTAMFLAGIATHAPAGSLFFAGADIGSAEVDSTTSTAYGLHLGTGIIPFMTIEGGYWDFGTFDRLDYTSLYLALKPNITLGPVHLYVKGGLNMYDIDGPSAASDDGTDIMYGAGAEYFIGNNFSLGASYMNFDFDKEDVDTLTLSATFHFL